MFKKYTSLFAILFSFLLLGVSYASAFAHGHTTVGKYELVIGFANEPAYQGEPNGLDLFVTNTETEEPVLGLEKTLKVEIIYGASKKELEMRTQWGEEGAYTARILPTEAGDYTWHIWGDIEGTAVDVSMTSSPDTFSGVAAKSTVSFPTAEPTTADLANSARMAMWVGALGVIVGVVGTGFGFMGYRAKAK